MRNFVTIVYTPHTQCKHSVRMTPRRSDSEIKLPDLYITHDVLDALGVKRTDDIQVTFAAVGNA